MILPTTTLYELKVELLDSDPLIWRRFRVPSTIILARLHKVLQAVMGWQESHLHSFSRADSSKCAESSPLEQFLQNEGDWMSYEYDFGDGWEHWITLEKVLPPDATGNQTALCLAGENAAPPEDCGGIPGYENFLIAIADPLHEEHDSMLRWAGGSFDPKAFDLTRINELLKGMSL